MKQSFILRSPTQRRGSAAFNWLVCLLVVVVVIGCRRASKGPDAVDPGRSAISASALNSPNQNSDGTRFQLLSPTQTGIDLVHKFPDEAGVELMTDQTSGSGVCIGDVDADGLADIYVTSYDQGNRLYRNLGGFRFEDITTRARVGGEGRWCGGATFVDVDNDSDLDLHVCAFNAPNLLYINQGDGTFVEQAAQRGLDHVGASVMVAFADYDRDGDLDGYLVTHRNNASDEAHLPRSTTQAMKRGIIARLSSGRGVRITPQFADLFQLMDAGQGRIQLVIAGQEDLLFQNDGNGYFRNVNHKAGISGHRIGLAASWWDYDEDGLPDLYVSNDYKGADQLYRNQGDGTFTDIARDALPYIPWFSMGSAIGDINNDGRVDLLATDMSGTTHYKQKMGMGDMQKDQWFLRTSDPRQYMRNALFLNTGTQRLMEAAQLTGIANSDWTWSPLLGDLDNDGWVDLFVSNGMSRDFMDSDLINSLKSRKSHRWLDLPVRKEENLAFRNTGDLQFDEVGKRWGLDQVSASYGAAVADLDSDGDLDLVAMNYDDSLSIYENRGTDHNGLSIRLLGTQSNRWGIGARVDLETQGKQQTRWVNSCQGFMSSSEPIVHFGVGNHQHVDRLAVTWPTGITQTFLDLDANQRYTITEASVRTVEASVDERRVERMFHESRELSSVRHHEVEFDDFKVQPLLPAKLSQQGPGLAVGDVNADGKDDIVISGAAGQPTQLIDGQSRRPVVVGAFQTLADREHLGSLLFDCDGDGDRDLYLVAGGVEAKPNSRALQDSLLLNDGEGHFRIAAAGVLPEFPDSGSCVVAADYDRDGDLDLFIGGRVHPGAFPTSPPSRLMRNDGGRFQIDDTALSANGPPLNRVTSAIWSDVNADGWIDLLVTQQWGPIRFFENNSGMLIDQTERAGLATYTGWWNGIAGGDVDGDGDVDYVVTNQGLNSKYHATKEHPTLLYYGDFERDGIFRIVEASYEDDILYPGRGRSCSTSAMPSLADRFESYGQFASAALTDVYSAQRLKEALRLEANTLETGILLNDGSGRFQFKPLPRLAQIAPAYSVSILDVDADGHLDIYLVHNNFSPEPETGRMSGGLSLLLRGDGDGSFVPVWPNVSGLIVPGDAKSLAVSDFNHDGRPDFLIGINDQPLMLFENNCRQSRVLRVTLKGSRQNTDAVGARVVVALSDGSKLTGEVYAGSGYLSQSARDLFFGLGTHSVTSLRISWPDNTVTEHRVEAESRSVSVAHPDSHSVD